MPTPPPPPPPQQTSPILTLAAQTSTRKRGWNIVDESSFSHLPTTKKKSRLRLTFCDAPENITNIDKRTTRSSKRNKK